MSNLILPFALLQSEMCRFKPSLASKILHSDKYHVPDRLSERGTSEEKQGFLPWPKHLVVLCDEKSGTIALCQQEIYTSSKQVKIEEQEETEVEESALLVSSINKFLVRIQPKVLLVPGLAGEKNTCVLKHVLVRCPASTILNASKFWLCTLHEDNILRLWNTDDGRCIIASHVSLLAASKGVNLSSVKGFPGLVIVVGDKGDLYIVNVFTMTCLNHLNLGLQSIVQCKYREMWKENKFVGFLFVLESTGRLTILADVNSDKNIKLKINERKVCENISQIEAQQKRFLHFSGHGINEMNIFFKFEEIHKVGGSAEFEVRRLKDTRTILTCRFENKDKVVVVCQDTIESVLCGDRLILKEFTLQNYLVFAKFVQTKKGTYFLLTIDCNCEMNFYEYEDLVQIRSPTEEELFVMRVDLINQPVFKLEMFDQAKVACFDFDNINFEKGFNPVLSNHKTKEEDTQEQLDKLKVNFITSIKGKSSRLRFCKEEKMLYSPLALANSSRLQGRGQEANVMLCWKIDTILELLNEISNPNIITNFKQIALNVSSLELFHADQKSKHQKTNFNCLIPFNSLILKSYFSRYMFQFFFTDETVTQSVMFTDKVASALIFGTNYGRIFMVQMFQEVEDKTLPVVLIDSHDASPIVSLFLAYSPSREIIMPVAGASPVKNEGGHLIAVSANGTVTVTDLKSKTLHHEMTHFSSRQMHHRKRAEDFMKAKQRNQQTERRHSFCQTVSFNEYFNYVRAKPDFKFPQAMFQSAETTKVDIFRIKTLYEAHSFLHKNSETQKKPTRHAFMYALLSENGRDLSVLTFGTATRDHPTCSVDQFRIKVSGLEEDEKVVGIFHDERTQNLLLLLNKVQVSTFNLRSRILNTRRRPLADVLELLETHRTVDTFMASNNHYFKVMQPKNLNLFDFQEFDKDFFGAKILKGLGTHATLDYLSMSQQLPMLLSPQHNLEGNLSKPVLDLLVNNKIELACFKTSDDAKKKVVLALNKVFRIDEALNKSDFEYRHYSETSGVALIQSQGNSFCNSNQNILIVNTKDMLPVVTSIMQRTQQKLKPEELNSNFERRQSTIRENMELQHPDAFGLDGDADHEVQSDKMSFNKWPGKILSLLHPFNMDEQLDENMEHFFNLNLPLLDFRLGIQGFMDAFSFIISKEDQDYHQDRESLTKVLSLLQISRQYFQKNKERQPNVLQTTLSKQPSYQANVSNFLQNVIDPLDSTLFLGKFFNSEYWKASPYLSTVIPAFMMSTLVSLVSYEERDIKILITQLLFVFERISMASSFERSPASPLESPCPISLGALSQLLLDHDQNVWTSCKDLILKPLLCSLNQQNIWQVRKQIAEWQCLVMDTYESLKSETLGKTAPPERSQTLSNRTGAPVMGIEAAGQTMSRFTTTNLDANDNGNGQHFDFNVVGETDRNRDSFDFGKPTGGEQRPLSHFFGQLEVRGIINLSFFSFYSKTSNQHLPNAVHLEQVVQDRVSKLVAILIREVVQQFKNQKDIIHLLTTLLQLLQYNLKISSKNYKRKAIMEDVVFMLFYIFNYYKTLLNKEHFITRVTSENFHLIRPTNPTLFLKLTAAKSLLEIGVTFTEDFLKLIESHATSLKSGEEYQRNVLEILRYFINGYGDQLERHLPHLVQILLRCLDPNDLALRKNSHKYISVILSTMVKIYPMVAFHHETQRLAVGTHNGPIGIYDVRTSAKWKILEGHTKNVTCLAFDSKGNFLASYSAVDLTLKLWKVGNTGFFSTIMGGTGRFQAQAKLHNLGVAVPSPHSKGPQAPTAALMDQQALLPETIVQAKPGKESSQLISSRQVSGNRINSCSLRFVLPAEKEVELVRENGQKELHNLLK